MKPLNICIITPSMNRAGMIESAIESVLAQDYPAFEHIIVDGGSTDGTLNLFRRYPNLKVITEPDQGMYDALNKGIRLTRGEIIGLLNTDDRYAPGVFAAVSRCFQENPQALAISGAATFFYFKEQRAPVPPPLAPTTPDSLAERLTTGIPAINSWFFRRTVFDKIGNFDVGYRVAADRDFLLRFACANLPMVPLQKEIIRYGSHEDSLTLYDVWKPVNLDENLQLAYHYGDRSDVPPAIRKKCHRWERIYTLEIIGHFLRCRDFASARRYFSRTMQRHWWWPLYFPFAFPWMVARYYLARM